MTNRISKMRNTRAAASVSRTTGASESELLERSTKASTPTPRSRRIRIRTTRDLLISL